MARHRHNAAAQYAAAGQRANEENDTAEAIRNLRTAVELEPGDPEFRGALGRLYYKVKEYEHARECFQHVLAIDFHDADAWKGMAFIQDQQGDTDDAIYSYLKYLEERPDDAAVHASLIEALNTVGKYEDAVDVAKRAIEKFPGLAGFRFLAAISHFDAGDLDDSIANLEQALQLDPYNSDIHRFLANVLATKGNMEAALAHFDTAIQLDPGNGAAYLSVSQLYNQMDRNGDYLEAARSAGKLFEAEGNLEELSRAYWEEGWALYKLGRWQESVAASEKSLRIDPSVATVQFNLALALLRNGETARAQQEYDKGLALGDVAALRSDGIRDLEAALREDSSLVAGPSILKKLKAAHAQAVGNKPRRLRSAAKPK